MNHTRNHRAIVAGGVFALLLAAAPGHSEASRFSGPYNATSVPKTYQQETVDLSYMGDYAPTYCEQSYGGWWDSWSQTCHYYYYTQAYYAGPERGDVLHFEAGAAAGVATMIQQMAFGDAALKIHEAVCSSASSYYGGCYQIWENTANMSIDDLFNGRDSCSDIEAFHSNELANLSPGLQWAYAMSTPYGQVTYFRPNEQSLIDSYSSNSYSHLGPRYGGNYTYKVGGYSRYRSYSMCSEAVSDAMGLNASEGARTVSLSKYEVQQTLNSAESQIRDLCWDEIQGKGAWWCWSQGGREGICHDIAHKALNAFMDEPWRNAGSPVARAVSGVTAPSGQYCHMAGGC